MKYNSKEQRFAPRFVEYGVRRSFGPEDLKDSDVDILCGVVRATNSSWLRTRIAHILWAVFKDYSFGQLAVEGYLNAFCDSYDPEHWPTCFEKIRTAPCICPARRR